jgi:uncharacterized protein (DUF305 family)
VKMKARHLTGALCLMFAMGLAACGSSEDNGEHHEGASKARDQQQAFLKGMVPHHESAVKMARIALARAEHPEIRGLARSIVSAQNREIAQIKAIHQRLYRATLQPDDGAHEALGLTAQQAGMDHDGASRLEAGRPFDRVFIDEMIGHHEGATRMAQAVLRSATDPEVRTLAQMIIRDQTREIAQMRRWRSQWYPSGQAGAGANRPSGGQADPGGEGGGQSG